MGYHPIRDVEHWGVPHRVYADLEAFLKADPGDGPAVHTIRHEDDHFDAYFAPCADADTLLVVFNSALSARTRASAAFPIFSGLTVAQGVPCHLLSISDPTLHANGEITIGWYVGRPSFDVASYCREVIRKLAGDTGVRKVVLLGFSLGGFAALNVAHGLPDALAFALNPQVSIPLYAQYHRDQLARAAFDLPAFSMVPAELVTQMRLDLRDVYAGGYDNYILYFQNNSDYHLHQQALPFMKALRVAHDIDPANPPAGAAYHTRNAAFYIGRGEGHWGAGHIGPQKERLEGFLTAICREAGSAAEIVSPQFVEHLARIDGAR